MKCTKVISLKYILFFMGAFMIIGVYSTHMHPLRDATVVQHAEVTLGPQHTYASGTDTQE